MDKIFYIALAVLNVLIAIFGLTIPLRIALGASALLLLFDAIFQAKRMFAKSEEEDGADEAEELS